MSILSGNLNGLKPVQLKNLSKLSKRRLNPQQIISNEYARALTDISNDISRQLGVLINRKGYAEHVIVGDSHKIVLPDLKRSRIGRKRFRGLRLLHTHLKDEGLTQDDLTDLAILRLDLVAAISFNIKGLPVNVYMAHLLPHNNQGELWRIFPRMHPAQLSENFLELIGALEEEFSKQVKSRSQKLNKNRALLIGVYTRDDSVEKNRLEELRSLAETAGINSIDSIIQIRPAFDPKFFMGRGKLMDTVLYSLQHDIEMLIFDKGLTPTQAKAISDFTDLKIIDRTQLILDIFAQHATTNDGKLQVEMAQLKYLTSRLSEKDDNMSRLTGGIGGRGPGETKLEIGKRRVQERIARLENQLKKLRSRRDIKRRKRKKSAIPVVSIIGYTNAGKSTLLNSLTNSNVLAENKLFATLDPTTRRVRFPEEREIVLSDTVGFIQDLPPTLLNAFKATLEELNDSNLLIHVVDISSNQIENQIGTINSLLKTLELDEIPMVTVFNQIDKFSAKYLSQRINYLEARLGIDPKRSIYASAKKLENLPTLLALIEDNLWGKKYSKNAGI